MQLNWPIIIGVVIVALVLLAYLIRQNLKDKKEADREFKEVKDDHKTGYETNEEDI